MVGAEDVTLPTMKVEQGVEEKLGVTEHKGAGTEENSREDAGAKKHGSVVRFSDSTGVIISGIKDKVEDVQIHPESYTPANDHDYPRVILKTEESTDRQSDAINREGEEIAKPKTVVEIVESVNVKIVFHVMNIDPVSREYRISSHTFFPRNENHPREDGDVEETADYKRQHS